MRNAKYHFYVVKLLKLPFEKCPEYVCAPKAWIAKSTRKEIFVRYPPKKIKFMKKLVKKRRKYERNWKFHRAQLIFGADTYDEVKMCIKEKKFNVYQDFWVPEKRTKFRIPKWHNSSSNHDPPTITDPRSTVDKPQMKVAPTRNYQNAALKTPMRRFSWPNTGTHKREVSRKLTTLSVKSANQATCSSESIKNMSEYRLLSDLQNQTNNQPNRTIVQMSTMINDVIDKACSQNVIMNDINSRNQAIQSCLTTESPRNQIHTLDHANCLKQKSHTQSFTADTEMKTNYERVYPNNTMHSKTPSVVSNSSISTSKSYQSFEHYNANQPLPHTDYLHPYTHGTLAGMSTDQRRSPQRHITNSASYPCRESEHALSFRSHLLTQRHKINSLNATKNTTSFLEAPLSQPVEDRLSLGLKDYLLLDQTSLNQVIKRTTGENSSPLSLKNTNPSDSHHPPNLINQYNRMSFQEHFSVIHENVKFEDLSTQTQDPRHIETVGSCQKAYSQSRQQDYTTLTNEKYSRPYITQPRATVEGYSNRDMYAQDMLIRKPINKYNYGVNHHKLSQGLPIPVYRSQPSTSIVPERNHMHTLPDYQDISNLSIHSSHSYEHSNIKQISPSDRNNKLQQDIRRDTFSKFPTDTINVNDHTQKNITNRNVKEIPSSTNNFCCSCKCLHHWKDQAKFNQKENNLKQSGNLKIDTENTSSHITKQVSKFMKAERFSPVRVESPIGEQSNNSESYTKSRLVVGQKSPNSKNISHDIRKSAEYKIITQYLGSYVKKMHLNSLRMLKMNHKEQRTLRKQKEILEDLMKLASSNNTNIDEEDCSSNDT